MNDLNQHYSALLGLDEPWFVEDVDLDFSGNEVIIHLNHSGGGLLCASCGEICTQAARAPGRTWRQLDTMQFKTEIKASISRSDCKQCGIKTIAVPWAGKHSRFTLMFEALAIGVLQASANVSKAADLLGLSWDAMHSIIERSVNRGLKRRSADKNVPDAEIVHDKFHIAKYLGEAVDKVRRAENKTLKNEGDDTLTGSRQLWLYNVENLDDDRFDRLMEIQRAGLKTGRAWAIKENFRYFWDYVYAGNAEKFFKRWYSWAIRSRLEPIKKVAVMLKKHLSGLLSYFRHRVTNATSEGFNSRIQSIKSSARGFRNFDNYRLRILFYCGKLDLLPESTH